MKPDKPVGIVSDDISAPVVEMRGLRKRFGSTLAVDGVDLTVERGELFAILGASGCGKTTLLRILAGFEAPSEGQLLINGVDMTRVPPYQRPVNMMFQSYALFPHLNVADNVAYGLKKEGVPSTEIATRVADMLALVQLSGLEQRRPDSLSGGERQRVALARALIKRPKLLLLDEPLAALDRKLRERTQYELMNLHRELGVAFIVVTHDQEEAMTLANRVAVMNKGRLEQVGTPREIYESPVNRFVAGFIGSVNQFEARVIDWAAGVVRLEAIDFDFEMEWACPDPASRGDSMWLSVRPEKIHIAPEAPHLSPDPVLQGVVQDIGYFGNHSVFRVKLASGRIIKVSTQNRHRSRVEAFSVRDKVYLSWSSANALVLRDG